MHYPILASDYIILSSSFFALICHVHTVENEEWAEKHS